MITTYGGRKVDPLNLKLEDINIFDIAHSLALVNRFNGHTQRPINVAQHSVFVMRICKQLSTDVKFHLQALLHDAAEAYLGDVTKWLKRTPEFKDYRKAEKRAQDLIWLKYECSPPINFPKDPVLEFADKLMVRYEAYHSYGPDYDFGGNKSYHPLDKQELRLVGDWTYWPWEIAETQFLFDFGECGGTVL